MSFYNMPAGCLGPSDIDHYAALGIEDDYCSRCRQNPCECCQECGAAPDRACEPDCGRVAVETLPEIPDALFELWQERSELFAPPRSDYHGD
jgi:hypothetical protein